MTQKKDGLRQARALVLSHPLRRWTLSGSHSLLLFLRDLRVLRANSPLNRLRESLSYDSLIVSLTPPTRISVPRCQPPPVCPSKPQRSQGRELEFPRVRWAHSVSGTLVPLCVLCVLCGL